MKVSTVTALLGLVGSLATATACRRTETELPIQAVQPDLSVTPRTTTIASAPMREAEVSEEAIVPPYVETGDLDALMKRGVLRILTTPREADGLQRHDLPVQAEREDAVRFAHHLGLEARILDLEDTELIAALVEGRGDIIVAHLTKTEARSSSVAFTRSFGGVDEVLVAAEGAENAPTKLEDLAGRTVTVVDGSAFEETLRTLQRTSLPTLGIDSVHAEEETLLHRVARKEVELTVSDTDTLAAVRAYTPGLDPRFAVAKNRRIAAALRKGNPELLRRANAFWSERALKAYRDEAFTDDLDAIKRRGVIRVLTRNNAINYFIYKGQEMGFEYELARLFAKELGVRLQMVVPPERKDLIPWLLEGRGDVIAASMTITDQRASEVRFTKPYMYSEEIVVSSVGGPTVTRLEDLAKKRFHVRRSSSHRQSLEALQGKYGPFEIVDVDERLETAEILHEVAKQKLPLTVADAFVFDVEKAYSSELVAGLSLTAAEAGLTSGELTDEHRSKIAWVVRPSNGQLADFLDAFIGRAYRGLDYNILKKRYFESSRQTARAREARANVSGRLSPYDEIIKKYASRYGFDWRLMAAQAFVESGFDPNARSWVGARGLFQVMPRTGGEMGYTKLDDPDEGTLAGIRYMDRLVDQLDPKIPLKHRIRFALAAYNAGLGHVYDAMRLAEEQGLDSKRWFGHVEKTMLLLSQPEYARRAKHGFAQGGQPVAYVSKIQALYEQYSSVVDP